MSTAVTVFAILSAAAPFHPPVAAVKSFYQHGFSIDISHQPKLRLEELKPGRFARRFRNSGPTPTNHAGNGSTRNICVSGLRLLRFRDDSCPHCETRLCSRCHERKHKGKCLTSYYEFRKVLEMAEREGWMRCRWCGIIVEKLDGCDSMRCRCGYLFCYGCGGEPHGREVCGRRGRCKGFFARRVKRPIMRAIVAMVEIMVV
ncbi:hypothetical protein BJY04DRAFT_130216 [Aspergillus karnatakaensis]|uniref:Rcat domain-containing protein n=1 Tax=Aspergillus karnatakaensis TaxID=1810916 RepID=UPI003CCE2229